MNRGMEEIGNKKNEGYGGQKEEQRGIRKWRKHKTRKTEGEQNSKNEKITWKTRGTMPKGNKSITGTKRNMRAWVTPEE